MGSLQFFARIQAKQSEVTDLNTQLQNISNQESQLTDQVSAGQQQANIFSQNGQNQQALDNTQNQQQQMLAQKQKQLDTKKSALEAKLQKANNELESLKKAQEQAQKNETPKYNG